MDSTATAAGLDDLERRDRLRLIRSEHVGPRTFHMLLRRFGRAAAALDALPDLARHGGANAPGRICSLAEAERELEACARRRIALLAPEETGYPPRLAQIDDPPPLLAVLGSADVLARPTVAVVGSRNASGAGLKFAAALARELGEAGFVVASGLARGIDQAAHRASVAAGTIAVLAGGLDRIYPPEHEDLFADIVSRRGAAISEMPLGHAPRAHDFPRRNRLISGVSFGVVVVEAARRSGSLITARFANEQGREVFAVPGSPLDPRCAGTNDLLRQGATLVTSATDVVETLTPMLGYRGGFQAAVCDVEPTMPGEPLPADRDHIVGLLGPVPISLDELVRLSGATPALVRTVLLELELAGRLERRGGLIALS